MVIFKSAGNRKLNVFSIIVINYVIAACLGFCIEGSPVISILNASWLSMAIIIGILFIVMFFVIALSTIKAGISATSVATKMSVIIPIIFSIIYFRENISFLKGAGIILAVIAVFLSIYKKEKKSVKDSKSIYLPFVLFLGAGLIDSLIKYTQQTHISAQDPMIFTSVLFSVSALTGIIISLIRWKTIPQKDVVITGGYGIVLGIVNFGSLYGLIRALESGVFDSSIIFGINNMGIVLLSVIVAVLFFSEKLTLINKAGIILSIIAIILLSLV